MRGHKADLVLIDEWRDFLYVNPDFKSEETTGLKGKVVLEELLVALVNTSERVTPAAVKGQGDVEQQAEEVRTQLSDEVER